MKRYVDQSLGFPVFYQEGQTIPTTAKPISEAAFQTFVATGKLPARNPALRKSTKKGAR